MKDVQTMKFLLFITGVYALDTKPCITCKYFVDMGVDRHSKCKKFPYIVDIMDDTAYGYIRHQYTEDYNYCSSARKFKHMCGEQGKHYESNDSI